MRFPALRPLALVALACTAAQDADAPASNGAASLQELKESATLLKTRVDAAIAERSDPPLLADPAGAVLVQAAFNRDTLRALPNDATQVNEVCTSVMAAGGAYAAYLRGASGDETVAQRATKIQDELALAYAAEDLCSKRLFALAAATPSRDPAAVAANRRVQGGAVQLQTGMLMAQTSDSVSDANKDLLLAALVEEEPTIVAGLTVVQRKDFLKRIDEVAAGIRPAAKDRIEQLRQAFASTDCTGLCAATTVKAVAGPHLNAGSDVSR